MQWHVAVGEHPPNLRQLADLVRSVSVPMGVQGQHPPFRQAAAGHTANGKPSNHKKLAHLLAHRAQAAAAVWGVNLEVHLSPLKASSDPQRDPTNRTRQGSPVQPPTR